METTITKSKVTAAPTLFKVHQKLNSKGSMLLNRLKNRFGHLSLNIYRGTAGFGDVSAGKRHARLSKANKMNLV